MVCWGRLVADVWDGLFAASTSKEGIVGNNALILDARIKHWTDNVLPTIPLLPLECPPETRQLRQHTIVQNSLDQLRLLLFRQTMLSLQYDTNIACQCRDIAVNIVRRAQGHSGEAGQQTSFRFHLASSLAGATLILATLLFRDHSYIEPDERSAAYSKEAYDDAIRILTNLASGLVLARRIKNDFVEVENLHQQTIDSTELNFGYVLPADTKELFPYTSLDYTQQSGFSSEAGSGSRVTNESGSASALNSDLWSSVFEIKEGKYGVPWI